MHQNNFIVCVKSGGRILRESESIVSLPFGSEYSILIKNLHSVRAQVSVSVDGTDATDGTRLIIGPNASVELERFIKNGNLSAGNRFKFIERTGAIEEHRGIGSDDGLIRVEAWKEHITQFVNVPVPRYHYYDHYYRRQPWYPWDRPYGPHYDWYVPMSQAQCDLGPPIMSTTGSSTASANTVNTASTATGGAQAVGAINQASVGSPLRSASMHMRSFDSPEPERSDAGITVPGSQSQQQFYSTSGFAVEPQSTVLVLRLRGTIAGQPVVEPVTVAAKPICVTCGARNKAINQFCGRCGTALSII